MGATISLICVLVDIAIEASLTVAEVTAEILLEVADGMLESLESLADTLDTFSSQTWAENFESLSEAAQQAIEDAVNDLSSKFDDLFDLIKNPSDAWDDYVSSLGEDSTTSADEANNALEQMKEAISKVCGIARDAEGVESSAKSIMGSSVSFLDLSAKAHTCGGDAVERDAVQEKLRGIRDDIHSINAKNAVAAGESQLKNTATNLGSAIFKKSVQRFLGSAGGNCLDAEQGGQGAVGNAKGLASEIKTSGKDAKTIFSKVAHTKACTLSDTSDSKRLKCPSRAQNRVIQGQCDRRLSEADASTLVPAATTRNNAYSYMLPMRMLCDVQGFREVRTAADALVCYESVLRETHLDWRHSPFWGHVTNTSCDTLLYAGSTDPDDGYCTVTRSTSPTPAFTVDRWGRTAYYYDRVHCRSLNESVHTLLTAAANNRPEFPLLRFVYRPENGTCPSHMPRHSTVFLERSALQVGAPTAQTFSSAIGALPLIESGVVTLQGSVDVVSVLCVTIIALVGVQAFLAMMTRLWSALRRAPRRRMLYPSAPPAPPVAVDAVSATSEPLPGPVDAPTAPATRVREVELAMRRGRA